MADEKDTTAPILKVLKSEQPTLEKNTACERCGLCKTSTAFDREKQQEVTKVGVWGVGPVPAKIMFVLEALGSEEVVKGIPAVGAAGQTFNKCLTDAGLKREDVYVTNVNKCRPPENRTPTPKEMLACLPYLVQEIQTVKPEILVLCGSTPLAAVLGLTGITKLHGQIFTSTEFNCKIIPIFHPSYVLRKSEDSTVRKKFVDDLIMIRRFSETGSSQKNAAPTSYKLIDTVAAFDALMMQLTSAEIVDFDLETSGKNPKKNEILCFSFSTKIGEGFVVPWKLRWENDVLVDVFHNFWGTAQPYIRTSLIAFFESAISKCAHAGSLIDIPFVRQNLGANIQHYDADGIIMDYLTDENKQEQKRGLKELAWTYTDMGGYEAPLDEWIRKLGMNKENMDFSRIPFEVLWPYSAADADVLGRCRRAMNEILREQELLPLFRKIVMPLQMTLCDIEQEGVQIDIDHLRATRKEHEAIVEDIKKQLAAHPITEKARTILKLKDGEEIKYTSPKQLATILFDILKLEPVNITKKTKKPATDKETLTILAEQHDLPRLIVQMREYSKLASYYGEEFEAKLDENFRVHTRYPIHGTRTQRLSSRDPNLQNIPRADKTADGSVTVVGRARDIFIAKPGFSLLDADYAQIEFKLLANYTKDPQMMSDVLNKVDIHVENATIVYGIKKAEVTKTLRQNAKPLTYALIYGAGAFRVSKMFDIAVDRAQQIIDALFSKYPGARKYHQSMIYFCRENGYVKNLWGFKRRLPGILSTDKDTREHNEREAINSPIQSLAAEILYVGMNRLNIALKQECPEARLVLTVHDSIAVECPDAKINEVAGIIQREMTKPMPGIDVPMEVEIKFGKSLGKMIPFKLDEAVV